MDHEFAINEKLANDNILEFPLKRNKVIRCCHVTGYSEK